MALTLYDATVGTYKQILSSIGGVLSKGREHCEANGVDLNDVVETRLIDDMLPFRFQVISVAHHSLGAMKGTDAGVFGPPSQGDQDYAALQSLVAEALAGLDDYSEDKVNGFMGKEMVFKMGSMTMPFIAEDFLLTFSLPNFYFHATTTYDIIRMQGATIGKGDFLGRMRLNR
ncbi:MAG: DUF1993 domain-containing protein [Gammaproteobacteria bacterium]|nr:DUF1993 domain-containing protein [Gammaproteobacteria bacterium]